MIAGVGSSRKGDGRRWFAVLWVWFAAWRGNGATSCARNSNRFEAQGQEYSCPFTLGLFVPGWRCGFAFQIEVLINRSAQLFDSQLPLTKRWKIALVASETSRPSMRESTPVHSACCARSWDSCVLISRSRGWISGIYLPITSKLSVFSAPRHGSTDWPRLASGIAVHTAMQLNLRRTLRCA